MPLFSLAVTLRWWEWAELNQDGRWRSRARTYRSSMPKKKEQCSFNYHHPPPPSQIRGKCMIQSCYPEIRSCYVTSSWAACSPLPLCWFHCLFSHWCFDVSSFLPLFLYFCCPDLIKKGISVWNTKCVSHPRLHLSKPFMPHDSKSQPTLGCMFLRCVLILLCLFMCKVLPEW